MRPHQSVLGGQLNCQLPTAHVALLCSPMPPWHRRWGHATCRDTCRGCHARIRLRRAIPCKLTNGRYPAWIPQKGSSWLLREKCELSCDRKPAVLCLLLLPASAASVAHTWAAGHPPDVAATERGTRTEDAASAASAAASTKPTEMGEAAADGGGATRSQDGRTRTPALPTRDATSSVSRQTYPQKEHPPPSPGSDPTYSTNAANAANSSAAMWQSSVRDWRMFPRSVCVGPDKSWSKRDRVRMKQCFAPGCIAMVGPWFGSRVTIVVDCLTVDFDHLRHGPAARRSDSTLAR